MKDDILKMMKDIKIAGVEVSYYPVKIMKVELIGEVTFNLNVLDEPKKYTDEEMLDDFLPTIKDPFDKIISIKTSFRNEEGDGNGKEED